MYILNAYKDNLYSILDTTDNTITDISKDWLLFLLEDGLQIQGCDPSLVLSDESIEFEEYDDFYEENYENIPKVSDLDISYFDITEEFDGIKFILSHKYDIPLYNFDYVLSKVIESDSEPVDKLLRITSVDSFDSKALKIICNNGVFSIDISDYISIAKAFYNNSVYNSVSEVLSAQKLLEQMINKNTKEFNHQHLGIHSTEMSGRTYRHFKVNNVLSKNNLLYNDCIKTDWGIIKIVRKSYNFDESNIGALFLTRYTNSGTLFYNLQTETIDFGGGTPIYRQYRKDGMNLLTSDSKISFLNDIYMQNLTYHNDLILPLCVSAVDYYDECVYINIVCLTDYLPEQGRWESEYGQGVVKIPLIFTDLLTEYDSVNDCFIFHTALNDIIIQKGVISHLAGSFNEADNCKFWLNNTRNKKVIKQYNLFMKDMSSELMKYFTYDLESEDDYEIELD